jgi:hypothetical protein
VSDGVMALKLKQIMKKQFHIKAAKKYEKKGKTRKSKKKI